MPRNPFPLATLLLLLPGLLLPVPARAQPHSVEIQASGEICTASWGSDACFPFTMNLPPAGGPAEGYVEGSSSYTISEIGMTIGASFSGHFSGLFEGGEGGAIGGSWEIVSTLQLPADLNLPPNVGYPTTMTSSGSWQGVLGAAGGNGTFSGSDSMGMPVSGTWSVAYDPDAFRAALPEPTAIPATATPAATATSLPTPTPPPPSVTPIVSLKALTDLIARQRTLLQSGLDAWRPGVVPWFNGRLVSAGIDPGGDPYVEDIYGRRTDVNEGGLPLEPVETLETPGEEIVRQNPEVDWGAQLETFGTQAWESLQNLLQPGVELFNQTLDGLNPSQSLDGLLSLLLTPVVGQDEGLTGEESEAVQVEAVVLQSQQDADRDCRKALGNSACEGEKLDLNDPSDYARWVERQRAEDRYFYTELIPRMKPEEWDRLVEGGFDPVQVIRSRTSMNQALKTINSQIGNTTIDMIEEQFGLDRKAADRLRAELVQLGADPEKADELARATQALRVITKLGADNTISNQGLLNGLFRFVDKWIVRKQAQDLMIENLDNLTDEQLALIQHADRGALVEALQAKQPNEDDPVYQLVLQQIEGGQP
ncbi:MAG: hypothetical protein ACK2TX_07615 [Anaerolineales bacterium]